VTYVLDTTVVIDHVNGYQPALELLDRLFAETNELYTCDVVTCEALSKGDQSAIAVKRSLLDALEFVALAPAGARWAAEQRRMRLESDLRAPSTTDALIAALARSLGATVVTRNTKDFESFDVPVLGYGAEGSEPI
jgi:predicted nucleic acid-binding protein